jgi:hypothetical protein
VDLDLYLLDRGGRVVGRSEGLSDREQVVVPSDGAFTVRVAAVGPVSNAGAYQLAIGR